MTIRSGSGKPPSLGKLELKIMQVLWQRGEATARQITEAVNEGALRPLSHSTVQTLLRKMLDKGALTQDSSERVFVFRPAIVEGEVATSATHDLLHRVFHGSASALVAHLLRHETIAPEELKHLQNLVARAAQDSATEMPEEKP